MDMSPIMNTIEKIADSVPKPVDGDYIGEDGLIHCGKCDGVKQCKVTFLGIEKVVPCICKCEKGRIEREKELAER